MLFILSILIPCCRFLKVSPHSFVAEPSEQEIHVTEQITAATGVVDREEVHNHENGRDSSEQEEEESHVHEVVDEIPDDSNKVSESTSTSEDVPKKSYASIVKVMKEGAAPPSTVTATVRSAPKVQEQQGTATPTPHGVPENPVSSLNAHENGVSQETEGRASYNTVSVC